MNASGLWPGAVITEVAPAGLSGRLSLNIRITWSGIPMDIPATSCELVGTSSSGSDKPSQLKIAVEIRWLTERSLIAIASLSDSFVSVVYILRT